MLGHASYKGQLCIQDWCQFWSSLLESQDHMVCILRHLFKSGFLTKIMCEFLFSLCDMPHPPCWKCIVPFHNFSCVFLRVNKWSENSKFVYAPWHIALNNCSMIHTSETLIAVIWVWSFVSFPCVCVERQSGKNKKKLVLVSGHSITTHCRTVMAIWICLCATQ